MNLPIAIVVSLSVAFTAAAQDGKPTVARERRLTKVTVLRPATETEVYAHVQKLSWDDATETFSVDAIAAIPERARPSKSTAFKFDAERGIYSAERAPTPAAVAARRKVQSNVGICDPVIESDCGGSGGGSGAGGDTSTATGHYLEAIMPLYINDSVMRTRAALGVTACRGDAYGSVRVDISTGVCLPGAGWAVSLCTKTATPMGAITSAASNLVRGEYVQNQVIGYGSVSVSSNGSAGLSATSSDVISTTYSSTACGNVSSPPGGGGPGEPDDPEDPDGEGESHCVAVYDGATGGYLGSCCGTTSAAIIKCAAAFL
jgi:hypothetical protein